MEDIQNLILKYYFPFLFNRDTMDSAPQRSPKNQKRSLGREHETMPPVLSPPLSCRPRRLGPEYTMIMDYAELLIEEPMAEQKELTIFIEPKIGTSYPDLVAVYWTPQRAANWNQNRKKLTAEDLKVLHCIWSAGIAPSKSLQDRFNNFFKSVNKLVDAGILLDIDGQISIDRESIFAIDNIIAIEGKIHSWQEGLSQALQNTWFASESYLLLNKWPRTDSLLMSQAELMGVGLLEPDMPFEYARVAPIHQSLPGSHASWLFNEWCWQYFSAS